MKASLLNVSILIFAAIACAEVSSAPQNNKTAGGAPMFLNFPTNYSLGEVRVLKRNAGSNESEPGVVGTAPARGPMRFPYGTRVMLKLSYDGAHHMADLEKVSPDGNGIFGINMKRLEVTDEDMKHLAKLTGLQHIELEGTDISSKGINNLEPLKNLLFLGVDKTLIRGDAMKSIGKHPKLENLIIGHNDLDDDCYKDLLGLKSVTNLQVDNVHLSDKGLASIVKLPSLNVLKLSGNNRITDRSIAMMQNSKLEALNVQNTGVGHGSLPYFLKMPRLRWLKLDRSNFTPAQQAEVIQKLPRVKISFEGKADRLPKELFDPLH